MDSRKDRSCSTMVLTVIKSCKISSVVTTEAYDVSSAMDKKCDSASSDVAVSSNVRLTIRSSASRFRFDNEEDLRLKRDALLVLLDPRERREETERGPTTYGLGKDRPRMSLISRILAIKLRCGVECPSCVAMVCELCDTESPSFQEVSPRRLPMDATVSSSSCKASLLTSRSFLREWFLLIIAGEDPSGCCC